MSLLEIFMRFMYVGLFTVGGGLASIPLMLQAIVAPGLVTEELFYSMIAISQSTPGPIGVNLATYIGFDQYGVVGGILATLGIIIPCSVISYFVSRAFEKVAETPMVKAAFYGIRAVVAGLIATAAWGVLRITVFALDAFKASGLLWQVLNYKALAVFVVLFAALKISKKDPIIFIVLGGVAGFVLF